MADSTTGKAGKWLIDSGEVIFKIDNDDKSRIEMTGVAGRLFEEGEIASKFFSEHGLADSEEQTLVLLGQVKITSEENEIYLTAKKVTYDEESQLITAEGSVWLRSDTWNLGPLDKLVSNPSLTKVGTPGTFQ